ncbi:MAG TPA: glycosyltransferase family 39 protein [Prolixibacteraceae bacterium]|jgi:4-amino-4-deoxy-L-arabinose transferase-like glycosyltransferase
MLKNNHIEESAPVWEVLFNRRFYWLLGILTLLALLKIVIGTQYDLDSEEAQYWLWSHHLQLSYYSKPPLIAYLNWFSTFLFGDNVFAIRINAVMIGLLASIVSYLLAYELFKDLNTAFFTAVITNLFPFMLHSSIIFTTDSLLLLFWLCALFSFWKAAQTAHWVWWTLFGLSIGLGALSKYTIFLIFIPLVIFALKYHREIFKSSGFYRSIVLALLIFSPVIYWNIQQKGLGFLHLIYLSGVYDHTHTTGQIISNIIVFVAGQAIILMPFYQYPELVHKFRQKAFTKQETFLLLPVMSMFLFFLIITIIRRSGAYMNWTMFAYTGMPLLFSHYAFSENRWRLNRTIVILMTVVITLFILLTLPTNRILPLGMNNPANKLIGWSQLASKVDSLKASMPAGSCYVFSTNYHITSSLCFYMKGQPEAYFLNVNSRMTQYDLWQGTEQFMNTDKIGILVGMNRITPEIRNRYLTLVKEDSCLICSQNRCIKTYYITLMKEMKSYPKRHYSY